MDTKISNREAYFRDNNIQPKTALELLEKREKSLCLQKTLAPSRESVSLLKKKAHKGKKGIEITSGEDSMIANSDTYAFSTTTNLKSPSRLDTLSVGETSPMLKRVKVSEEEEKTVPGGDHFQLTNNSGTNSSLLVPVRKSTRKRTKSKILREAIGELDEEPVIQPVRRNKKDKETREVSKFIELDRKAKKREEPIPLSQDRNYLVEYIYDYGGKDPEPVGFGQTVSYDEMVAGDNKSCPIEWFHFNGVGLKEMPTGNWYCAPGAKNILN